MYCNINIGGIMKIRIISAIVAFLIFIPVFLMGGNIFKAAFYLLALQGVREFINVREKKKEFPNIIKLIAKSVITIYSIITRWS